VFHAFAVPGGPVGASVSVSQATDVNGAIAAAESAGAGASFLATAVKESGGDLSTLRERLLGALTLVDQMLAFSSPPVAAPASSTWEAEYTAPVTPPPPPPPPAAAVPPRAPIATAPPPQTSPPPQPSPPGASSPVSGYAAQLAAAQAAKVSASSSGSGAAPAAAAAPSFVAPAPAPASTTGAAAPYTGLPVPLPESAIERMRTAMALLVKHRGGGPFGAGRLSQEEVPNLEAALADVLDVIKQVREWR